MRKMKGSPVRRYRMARSVLLFVIVMTALNCFLYLINSGRHYVCSVFLAYLLFDLTGINLLLAALVTAPYVLAYIYSKRRGGWMIAAALLYLADTLIVVYAIVTTGGEAIVSVGFELVSHVLITVLLFLGAASRKVGVMTDEELMAAAEAGGASGEAPTVSCAVSVSENGTPNDFVKSGCLRFEPEELVVGSQGTTGQILVGSMLASMKEAARFGYGDIKELQYTDTRQLALQMDLTDGRIVCMAFISKADRGRFEKLLRAHGVALSPAKD